MVLLTFYGTEKSETHTTELSVYCNEEMEIMIDIWDKVFPVSHICLDKETAIKFSKELRKQIALIQDEKGI
jgi:hypothetical protein